MAAAEETSEAIDNLESEHIDSSARVGFSQHTCFRGRCNLWFVAVSHRGSLADLFYVQAHSSVSVACKMVFVNLLKLILN